MEQTTQKALLKCVVFGVIAGPLALWVMNWSEGWLGFVVVPMFFIVGLLGGNLTTAAPYTGIRAPSLAGTWITFSACVGTYFLLATLFIHEEYAAPQLVDIPVTQVSNDVVTRALSHLEKVNLPAPNPKVVSAKLAGTRHRLRVECMGEQNNNYTYYIDIPERDDQEPQLVLDESGQAPPPGYVEMLLITLLGGALCATIRFGLNQVFHGRSR